MTCLNSQWFFRYIVSVWIFVHDYMNDALVFLFIYKEMKKPSRITNCFFEFPNKTKHSLAAFRAEFWVPPPRGLYANEQSTLHT